MTPKDVVLESGSKFDDWVGGAGFAGGGRGKEWILSYSGLRDS